MPNVDDYQILIRDILDMRVTVDDFEKTSIIFDDTLFDDLTPEYTIVMKFLLEILEKDELKIYLETVQDFSIIDSILHYNMTNSYFNYGRIPWVPRIEIKNILYNTIKTIETFLWIFDNDNVDEDLVDHYDNIDDPDDMLLWTILQWKNPLLYLKYFAKFDFDPMIAVEKYKTADFSWINRVERFSKITITDDANETAELMSHIDHPMVYKYISYIFDDLSLSNKMIWFQKMKKDGLYHFTKSLSSSLIEMIGDECFDIDLTYFSRKDCLRLQQGFLTNGYDITYIKSFLSAHSEYHNILVLFMIIHGNLDQIYRLTEITGPITKQMIINLLTEFEGYFVKL